LHQKTGFIIFTAIARIKAICGQSFFALAFTYSQPTSSTDLLYEAIRHSSDVQFTRKSQANA
jgi:hypothetical protein